MQYLAIAATVYCFVSLFVHFVRIVRLGAPKDMSEPSGSVAKGVAYSNTTAMMPQNKESAFLHLPEYASGMLFHIGLFTCLLLFVLSFFPFFNRWISGPDKIHYIIPCLLAVTAACGYILLLRRALSKDLKPLSNPDDYISNALVSTFQLMTVLYLLMPTSQAVVTIYYVAAILLFLYMPLGKLRHAVYYFAARYHLGFFYGWRNVWPKHEN